MTLHDVSLMSGYWRRNPPLRVLISSIAVAMGVPAERLFHVKTVKDLTAEDYDMTPKKGHVTFEQFERHIAATGGKIDGIGQVG